MPADQDPDEHSFDGHVPDERVFLSLRPGVGPGRPSRGADLDPHRVVDASSYAELVEIIDELHLDHAHTGSRQWRHNTLESFLEALAAVVAELPSEFEMAGEPFPEQPTWGLLAQILVAATDWE